MILDYTQSFFLVKLEDRSAVMNINTLFLDLYPYFRPFDNIIYSMNHVEFGNFILFNA